MSDAPHDRQGTDLPLSGRSVILTRAAEQSSALAGPLTALGAEVLIMPVIAIVAPEDWAPADRAIERLGEYDWIVLTSTNGVDALDARMHEHGLRLADLQDRRIAVVGSATAARLRGFGLEPAIVPEKFRAEGLIDALRSIGPQAGERVLIARAAEAREVLPSDLRDLGFQVDVVPVYRVVSVDPPADVLDRLETGRVDAVVFASGGTARRFAEVVTSQGLDPAALLVDPIVASIGPVTTEALHELGVAVDVQAATATSASLVAGLVRRLGAAS